jgi:rare lipoprotein A (peptidoglycan hydrolase)
MRTSPIRRSLSIVAVAMAVCATLPLAPTTAGAVPATSADSSRTPYPDAPLAPPTGLDEATRRAEELQRQVNDIHADAEALDARVRATTARIMRQAVVLERSRVDVARAREAYDRRIIDMYKSSHTEPLLLLLDSGSIADVLDRGAFLLSIVDQDRDLLTDATATSAEAAFQAKQLDLLKSQDLELRGIHAARLKSLEGALGEQTALVARLNAQQRAYVDAKARLEAEIRARWAAGTYTGSTLQKVAAVVEPYLDRTYLVDQGEPLEYVTTGRITTEIASWYGNADNRPTPTATASGRAFNENEFTCASLKFPFWTRLAVSRGEKRIIVTVTDHGPYIQGRTLDLSKSAARALGFDGVEPVTCEVVDIKR